MYGALVAVDEGMGAGGGRNVAALPVSGTLKTGDTAAFVSGLSNLHNLKANQKLDGTIILYAVDPKHHA